MPSVAARVRDLVLDVCTVDLSELRKAGGAAHCLTTEAHPATQPA